MGDPAISKPPVWKGTSNLWPNWWWIREVDLPGMRTTGLGLPMRKFNRKSQHWYLWLQAFWKCSLGDKGFMLNQVHRQYVPNSLPRFPHGSWMCLCLSLLLSAGSSHHHFAFGIQLDWLAVVVGPESLLLLPLDLVEPPQLLAKTSNHTCTSELHSATPWLLAVIPSKLLVLAADYDRRSALLTRRPRPAKDRRERVRLISSVDRFYCIAGIYLHPPWSSYLNDWLPTSCIHAGSCVIMCIHLYIFVYVYICIYIYLYISNHYLFMYI